MLLQYYLFPLDKLLFIIYISHILLRCFCKAMCLFFNLVFLTYAVWDALQQVLCEQQVSESQEAIKLWGELLQTILWHVQTHQSPEVPQLLHTPQCHLSWTTETQFNY